MIKFGNDIVTVGGDWLKMPTEPEPDTQGESNEQEGEVEYANE